MVGKAKKRRIGSDNLVECESGRTEIEIHGERTREEFDEKLLTIEMAVCSLLAIQSTMKSSVCF